MYAVGVLYDEADGINALPSIILEVVEPDTMLVPHPPLFAVYLFSDEQRAREFMHTLEMGVQLQLAYARHAQVMASRASRKRERERIRQVRADRARPKVVEFTLLDELRELYDKSDMPVRVINPIIRRCKIYPIREDQLHSTQAWLERYNEESRAFMAKYPTLAVFIEALKVYPLHTFGIKNFGEKCRSYLLDAIENR